MKIKTTKVRKKFYTADFLELPGSPYIGSGETRIEAVICLFVRNVAKLHRLDYQEIILDGKLWKEPR